MRHMPMRDVRLVEANIVTGLQPASSFFASTALPAIGALFGLLSAAKNPEPAWKLKRTTMPLNPVATKGCPANRLLMIPQSKYPFRDHV